MSAKVKTLTISRAKYVSEHKLQLVFSDGKVQIVDFGPFLKNAGHPEIRKYLNTKLFKRFSIKDGELMWGDFDLIFPILDIYENNLDRNKSTVDNAKVITNAR